MWTGLTILVWLGVVYMIILGIFGFWGLKMLMKYIMEDMKLTAEYKERRRQREEEQEIAKQQRPTRHGFDGEPAMKMQDKT